MLDGTNRPHRSLVGLGLPRYQAGKLTNLYVQRHYKGRYSVIVGKHGPRGGTVSYGVVRTGRRNYHSAFMTCHTSIFREGGEPHKLPRLTRLTSLLSGLPCLG